MPQSMPPESLPTPAGGPFSERFQRLKGPYLDPAFTLWPVRDVNSGEELFLQYFPLPPSGWPSELSLQWEALQACRDSLWLRPQEKLVTGSFGGLLYWVPPGRPFNEIRGTLRDEVYLQWLQDALHDLHQLHRRGILHLAQNPRTWIVFKSDENVGPETMGLSDVSLHLEILLGQGMQSQTAVAIAPEILRGGPVDVRADLYSLAALILFQRSAHLFHQLKTFPDWIKAHWQGELHGMVPERTTPLNEILRQMLQPNPNDRPESVAALIKTLDPQNPLAHMTTRKFQDWSEQRVQWRQATLISNTLYTLLELGEASLAATMLEALGPFWQKAHEPYRLFFQGRLLQAQGDLDGAQRCRDQAREKSNQDPKLQALLALEETQCSTHSMDLAQSLIHLQKAWEAAAQTPDSALQVKVLLERGRIHKASGADVASLQELKQAFDLLPQVDLPTVRAAVLGELADGLNAYGFFRQAQPLLDQALEFTEPDTELRARRLLQGALGAMLRSEWQQSREYFQEARHLLSSQKDLAGLVWAMAHEVRLSIAREDWEQVRRELKALRVRNRGHSFHENLLNLLEWQLTQATQKSLSANPEKLYAGLESLVQSLREGGSFQDLAWSPALTAQYLETFLQRQGRLAEAIQLKEIYQQVQAKGREVCLQLGFSKEAPIHQVSELVTASGFQENKIQPESPPSPSDSNDEAGLPVALSEPLRGRQAHYLEEQIRHLEMTKRELLKENLQLNQEILALRGQLENLSRPQPPKEKRPKPVVKPKPKVQPSTLPPPAILSPSPSSIAEEKPISPPVVKDSSEEREQLLAALKRHQGHRSRAAKELGIHRRTILEKIKRHGLEGVDFLPDKAAMEQAMTLAQGNRSKAAKSLGMSRTSFYRRLKDLGLESIEKKGGPE